MSEERVCATCGNAHDIADCTALKDAAGALPKGVPLRVYGGYLEARAALRANAPAVATRCLQWLLSHMAEERGTPAGISFSAKMTKLRDQGVISPRVQSSLFERALSASDGPEQAWALMSIVEHAFYRLYLQPSH